MNNYQSFFKLYESKLVKESDEIQKAIPHAELLASMENSFEQEVKDKLNNFEHEILALIKTFVTDAKTSIPGAQTKFKKIAKKTILEQVQHLFS